MKTKSKHKKEETEECNEHVCDYCIIIYRNDTAHSSTLLNLRRAMCVIKQFESKHYDIIYYKHGVAHCAIFECALARDETRRDEIICCGASNYCSFRCCSCLHSSAPPPFNRTDMSLASSAFLFDGSQLRPLYESIDSYKRYKSPLRRKHIPRIEYATE